mgnify:CR=1 FL=1
MLTRILTAIPLIGAFFAALFWASEPLWIGLILVTVFLGAAEWAALSKVEPVFGYVYALGVTSAMLLILSGGWETSPWVYAACMLIWLAAPAWMRGALPWPGRALALFLGAILLAASGLAIIALREFTPWLVFGVLALVAIADSGAYFAGRKFGRHKLAPSISPGKTWEGVAGAAVGVALFALSFQTYARSHAGIERVPELLAIALCLLALSILGDLFESAAKRRAGVKDSGTLLPGHGGVLDRIDGLLAALPAAALLYFWP